MFFFEMLNASVHKPLLMITVLKTLDKGLMVIITRLPTVYDVHEHKKKFLSSPVVRQQK